MNTTLAGHIDRLTQDRARINRLLTAQPLTSDDEHALGQMVYDIDDLIDECSHWSA
ncbi:hypothetical protein [Aeromicrobium sp. 179-A 4D2 NHS]|uniref:hypothetical protein n=1 Tax=Aeromicrobium sp. 179-A 4D2 NHS TaxID=3142375 RepID=UPI0039A32E20